MYFLHGAREVIISSCQRARYVVWTSHFTSYGEALLFQHFMSFRNLLLAVLGCHLVGMLIETKCVEA